MITNYTWYVGTSGSTNTTNNHTVKFAKNHTFEVHEDGNKTYHGSWFVDSLQDRSSLKLHVAIQNSTNNNTGILANIEYDLAPITNQFVLKESRVKVNNSHSDALESYIKFKDNTLWTD